MVGLASFVVMPLEPAARGCDRGLYRRELQVRQEASQLSVRRSLLVLTVCLRGVMLQMNQNTCLPVRLGTRSSCKLTKSLLKRLSNLKYLNT